AAFGRVEQGLLLDLGLCHRLGSGRGGGRGLVVRHVDLPESTNLSSVQDERFCLPRFHPRSRRLAPRSRGRANGRIPDRFAGRSRVVPGSSSAAGLPALSRLSLGDGDGRVPIVAFRLWWATLDSNQ